jgi:hypothetical protein
VSADDLRAEPLPCKCGHSAWDHWLLRGECDKRADCKCQQFELHDPRPDDMAELARKVAIELRKRAIWAEVESGEIYVPRVYGRKVKFGYVGLYRADFDNLGPNRMRLRDPSGRSVSRSGMGEGCPRRDK